MSPNRFVGYEHIFSKRFKYWLDSPPFNPEMTIKAAE
jgi:hypothetical protein